MGNIYNLSVTKFCFCICQNMTKQVYYTVRPVSSHDTNSTFLKIKPNAFWKAFDSPLASSASWSLKARLLLMIILELAATFVLCNLVMFNRAGCELCEKQLITERWSILD